MEADRKKSRFWCGEKSKAKAYNWLDVVRLVKKLLDGKLCKKIAIDVCVSCYGYIQHI